VSTADEPTTPTLEERVERLELVFETLAEDWAETRAEILRYLATRDAGADR
jgi:hypothetical protein